MPITMKQIAVRSGVSRPTVSLVLNGKAAHLPQATRERVLEMAQKLGYRPNGSARATRSGRFDCAALIQSTQPHHSYMPGGLLDGIHDALGEHHMRLTLARLTDSQLADKAFVPQILREWTSDGLLIDYINDIPQRLIDLVAESRMPAIWINSKHPVDCVHPDDFGGAYEATRRLIALGHRRIAYAIYSRRYTTKGRHYSEFDRRDGYRQAMEEAGLQPVLIGDGQVVPRAEAMSFTRQWLVSPDRPTAVLTYSGSEPAAVYFVANQLELRVPGDLSLVAFGQDAVDVAGVQVSTVAIPQAQVGQLAVECLLKRIACPSKPLPAHSVPLQWIEGQTIAPPRAG